MPQQHCCISGLTEEIKSKFVAFDYRGCLGAEPLLKITGWRKREIALAIDRVRT
jgi:hypothetical protein